MKTLFLLLRVYALELFGLNRRLHMPGKKSGKRLSAAAAAALGVLIVAGTLAIAGFYCYTFCFTLYQVGLLHLFPGLVMALLCLMDLITTVTRASDVLIKTRDFDLVTALPIPAWTLATSRVVRLYLINLVTTMLIWLPAGACYAWFAHPAFGFYPVYLLCMFLSPLLPVAVASVIGMLITSVSAVLGNGKSIRLALSLAFPLLIMYFSFSMSFSMQDEERFMAFAGSLGDKVYSIWPPARLFAEACVDLNMSSFALFAGISVAAFALFCVIYGKLYVKLNSISEAKRTKARKVTAQGAMSVRKALYVRELRRYLSCNAYVMNTAFGMLMSLIAVAALCILGMDKLAALMQLEGFEQYISAMLPFVLAWMVSMSVTTSASISLEGHTLWIIRSAPVDAFDWLMAKMYLSLTVILPVVAVDAAILSVALKLSAAQAALFALLPMSYGLFMSLLGLFSNLRFRKMDWSTEIVAIKQSLSVAIPVLAGMFLTFGPAAAMGIIGGSAWTWMPWACTGGALLLSLLLLLRLKSAAQKKLDAIE